MILPRFRTAGLYVRDSLKPLASVVVPLGTSIDNKHLSIQTKLPLRELDDFIGLDGGKGKRIQSSLLWH
jgi:hypothetical protein